MRREFDEQFHEFERLYKTSGKALIPLDFDHAFAAWRILDWQQRAKALDSIEQRLKSGAWSDPHFVPKPANYIREREFDRPVSRPKPHSGASMTAEEIAAL